MNKKNLIVTMIVTLLLTGCSLAQPENPIPMDDRMVGVFVTIGEENTIHEDESWVSLGTEQIDTEVGSFKTDRKVLIGTYDEKEQTYRFGNHKGFLCLELVDEKLGHPDFSSFTNLDDVTCHHTSIMNGENDFDTESFVSGTLYLPQKSQEEKGRIYKVFQSKDGTIFLDGSMNSTFEVRDKSGFSVFYEYKSNDKDEEHVNRITVKADIKFFSNSKDIIVYQYDADGNLLERQSIGLSKTDTSVSWLEHASFAIVEEVNDQGNKREMIDKQQNEENQKSYTYHMEDDEELVKTVEVSFK